MGVERAGHELEVFRQFAVAAGLSTSQDCGEKRKWPEPDILFQDADGSYTAFELVELLDQEYRGRIGLLVATKTALHIHYEGLPNPELALFDAKYSNALLYFCFLPTLTFKRRRAAFGRIFARLLTLPNGFSGDAFENDPDLSDVVSSVSVLRGRFVGPIFDPESIGRVGDPTIPVVQQKFAKTYKTPHPIELLAHIETNPMFPDDVWIADLEAFLASQSYPLPFRRIWVFHAVKNEVKFKFPQ